MPRRHQPDYFRGYAPGLGFSPINFWAKGRTKGIAQKLKSNRTAGHSHRLTSGGKAEPTWPMTFEAKLQIANRQLAIGNAFIRIAVLPMDRFLLLAAPGYNKPEGR